jgi:hypothetical protein
MQNEQNFYMKEDVKQILMNVYDYDEHDLIEVYDQVI